MMRLLTIVILLIGCNQQLELCCALSNDQIAIQLEFLAGQYSELKQELRDVKEKLEHVTKDNVLLRQENGDIKTLLKTLIKATNEPFHKQSMKTDSSEEFYFLNRPRTNDHTVLYKNDSEVDEENGPNMEHDPLRLSKIRTPEQRGSLDKRLLLGTLTRTSTDDIAKVAFTAMLTTQPSLGDKQTVEFDKVITNVGNGYDPRHGHFIAPVKGVYLMGFTVMNEHGTSGYIVMVRNGFTIANVFLRAADYSMGTQFVLVVLEQGDMVWVRRFSSSVVVLDGSYNTFSVATTSPDIAKCAFTAVLTTHPSLGDAQTIEFKKVITNVGNGYDPRNGRFIAPVKGVYLMGFTVMSEHGTSGYIVMVRNDVVIADVYLSHDLSMGTQFAHVVLEKGDMVWLRRGGSTAITLDAVFNTFSGALLYQI